MKTLSTGVGSWRPIPSWRCLLRSRLPLPSLAAQKNYRENRENGSQQDSPNSPFPSAGFDALDIKSSALHGSKWPDSQGRYWWKLTLQGGRVVEDFYWTEDEIRGFPDKSDSDRYWFIVHHKNGTKMEGFCQEPDRQKGYPDSDGKYWWRIKYTECGAIKQWMEEKDCNYLTRIQRENPALFNRELTELKAANPAHPAIGKLEANMRREEQQRLIVEREKAEAAERTKVEQQQQQQAEKEALERELAELELVELRQKVARLKQQQSSPQVAPPLSSKEAEKAEKQAVTTPKHHKPSLSEDTMQQMALIIRYEDITLLQKLGGGEFGVVYQGRWHYEDVAVKKLHIQKMSENALIEFKQEAAIMARLRSDYIVTLKGIALEPYALVMEYMRGGSLFELLHSRMPVDWHVRHRLAQDVAMGLHFLHRHEPRILHRDLKSHNVLLTEHNRAKLADFGLSKVRIESSRSQTQSSKKSVGTIPWMAPECFGIRPKYSEKSDMYAYGMVLWEIASRKMPYEEVGEPTEIRDAVKDGEREEIPEKASNPADPLPTSYKELINVCWFQAPSKRPMAKEAIEMLNIDQTQTSSASSSSSSSSMSGFFDNFSSKG